MNRYISSLICFLLTLFSCFSLQADEISLQLLGPREGDPSCIVEGVSTILGDYSEVEVDLVVPAPDRLVLSRFYSSGDHLSSANFGGWRLFPKCILLLQKDPKGKTDSTSEGKFDRTYVRVGTDEGSILTYVGWQNTSNPSSKSLYKVDVEDLVLSMANTARGNPHWKNNELRISLIHPNRDISQMLPWTGDGSSPDEVQLTERSWSKFFSFRSKTARS